MPPKKAAAPAAAAAGPPPEEQAERLVLIEECKTLAGQRIAEQAQFQLIKEEKEKLNFLWAASKKELEDRRAEARAQDRMRADTAEAHAVELKVHKTRIKHLLFEHQGDATDGRTDGAVGLKLAQEAHRESERELKADKRDLSGVLREMETAHDEYVRTLRAEQDRAITQLRHEFERETRELGALYEERMLRLREALTRAREDEIRSVERKKTRHIATLIAAHEKAFADIRLYYNEITHSNLDLIKSLKEEAGDLKKKEAGDERVMYAIAQENKKMSEPMRKALEEVRRLRDEREVYRADIQALHEAKAAILVVQDRLENTRWEHEILEQRHLRLAAERDELYARFSAALHAVKQKAGFRGLLLESQLAAAAEEVERQSITLAEVLLAANLDPRSLGAIEKRLADAVAAKDAAVAGLQADLLRAAAAHDAALERYERAMADAGIPGEELGFRAARAADLLADLLQPGGAPAAAR